MMYNGKKGKDMILLMRHGEDDFTCPTGRLGILSSMYTDPDYRRMGIATQLLDRVVKEAKDYGCGTIYITASNMGVKLYEAYGFKHNGNFMQLNF